MLLSVVIPTFNRKVNLAYCLKALANQIDPPEFEVIVVDDGSTDGTKQWLYANFKPIDEALYQPLVSDDIHIRWLTGPDVSVPLTYLSGGPNKGFRGGRARNIGSFNSRGDRLLFVDSDVVLNQEALRHYALAAVAQPQAIIVGRYDWLAPLDLFAGNEHWLWEASSLEEVIRHIKVTSRPDDSPFGHDQRHESFTHDLTKLGKGAALGALSGNISYPKQLFEQVGGFDEKMVGHGGEDAMLGLTVDDKVKPDWLFYAPLYGFHLWHERDQARNQREVDANIEYIDRTFGIGRYKNAMKWSDSMDKSNPGHYHHHQGALAARTPTDQTVWLIRTDHMTRIGVTTHDWLLRMGFMPLDVKIIPQEEMDKYQPMGVTRQLADLDDLKVETTSEH